MNLEEFKTALEATERGSELLEFFNTSIQTEKQRGIDESRKANKEALNYKRYKQAVERLGYDGQGELDDFITTLTDTVDGNKVQGSAELTELQSNLKKLQRSFELAQGELKTEREQRESLQKQNRIKTIEGNLTPKLSDELHGVQYLVKSLIADGQVDINDNGEIVFKKGDQVLGYDDGIKHVIASNPDLRKNRQIPGAGSSGSSITTLNRPKYTIEQIKSMTPEQIAADVKNVNESVKAFSK